MHVHTIVWTSNRNTLQYARLLSLQEDHAGSETAGHFVESDKQIKRSHETKLRQIGQVKMVYL
ncbi:MAG: hypothetical protein DF199_06670 [Lactobacillus delbrueckii subsp. lactis]|nr:MAG: hypothetical protein DF199_06670 [Lactobacillus delbrueckii subsp. lactis]